MIAFATSTRTKKNVEVLRAAGWGLLLTPLCPEDHGFDTLCVDNGAWTCYMSETTWQPEGFVELVKSFGQKSEFVVAPDIVAGGLASLKKSLGWVDRLCHRARRVLIPVQDGMVTTDLEPYLDKQVGIFVGGTTEFKEGTMRDWGRLAKEKGCWLHVGRVNTARRIHLCHLAGAHSFDGTNASRFSCNVPRLDRARRQRSLFNQRPL